MERTEESLERYRTFGARVIKGLSSAEQEINKKALDKAIEDAFTKIREFHGREEGLPAGTAEPGAPTGH